MLLPKSCALAHYKDIKKFLFSSAGNNFIRPRLRNAVPNSDSGHSENLFFDYLALKI